MNDKEMKRGRPDRDSFQVRDLILLDDVDLLDVTSLTDGSWAGMQVSVKICLAHAAGWVPQA